MEVTQAATGGTRGDGPGWASWLSSFPETVGAGREGEVKSLGLLPLLDDRPPCLGRAHATLYSKASRAQAVDSEA